MSGRGKGGKGLGKGGAKRHRKILRDNIQGGYLLIVTYIHLPHTDPYPQESLNPLSVVWHEEVV
jgi:hypothetical protein